MDFQNPISSLTELLTLHNEVSGAARDKQLLSLDVYCQEFIAASPMLLLSTSNIAGLCDVSPRGDAPGFVQVLSDTMLAIPERLGNNRLDSARNILENPKVGLIFLIPDVLETLRVSGRAGLVRDPELLESFRVNQKIPKFAVVVHVEEAFLQCGKAFKRSGLWQPETWTSAQNLTSRAKMLAGQTKISEQELESTLESAYREHLY
jgi:PPOX class probable FMN-dependent enzyme